MELLLLAGQLWAAPGSSWQLWAAPDSSGQLWVALGSSGQLLAALGSSGQLLAVLVVAQPTVADPRFYDGNFLPSC